MIPKLFKELIANCNACILSCEACIRAAESCEKNAAVDKSCQDFIERTKDCAAASQVCIKTCDEAIAVFKRHGHNDHMEALNACVKALGENIRTLQDSANKCTIDQDCHAGCRAAKHACNNAIRAVDECIESCEKHEVHYLNIKQ